MRRFHVAAASSAAFKALAIAASISAVLATAVLTPARAASEESTSTPASAGVSPKPIVAQGTPELISRKADKALANDLKHGGYVIFFRHAITDWQQRDADAGNFADRSAQRNLSEAGREEATGIGKAVRALEIPIAHVLASPMWRCRDTAELAFGQYDTTGMLYFKGPRFREARIQMLGTPPEKGKNLVLVGHQDQLIPIVPGLRRDELKEGDALVFRPLGQGKYRVVAQVTPADWARLAGLPEPTQASTPPGSMPALPDSARGH